MARTLITREIPVQAYVSLPPPHGPLGFYPQPSREVKGPARCKWHSSVLEAQRNGEIEGDWTGTQLFSVMPTAA